MKVAIVLPQDEKMHPYYGGAIARWVAEVYLNRSHTIDFTIFSTHFQKEGAYELPVQGDDFLDHCIRPFLRFPRNDVLTLRGLPWMAWLCFSTQYFRHYDAVYIHNQAWYAIWLRKLGYRGKIILHMHNAMETFFPEKSKWSEIYKSIDMAVFCSDFILQKARTGFEAILKQASVVYNGVYISPSESLLERRPNTILFAGRLVAEKGLLEAIAAVEELRRNGTPAQLRVAGAAGFATSKITPYMAQAQQKAEAVNLTYGPEVITFLGYQAHEDLLKEMAQAQVFLSPVLWDEPFGMVMAEAMSVGTPVVASRRGGIPEVLGDTGSLVDNNNPVDWAQAIQPYLENDAYWLEQSHRAKQFVSEDFSWQQISRDYEQLLQTHLKN